MLAPGTLLQNRYSIARLIAEGGMGAVYLARDQRLDNMVALKETLFTDERMSKAFEREARLLARLRHPALPRVSDHFIDESGQFLVMEYIPGDDLAQILKRQAEPLSCDEVIRWADQLLDALEYLHTQDPPIVHRDIKPQNLKVTERGQIILLDFGLAKGMPLQMTRVTSSGSIYGYTPNYAPMEQIQGLGTDPRSDLYSLGATLYHLVTGRTPTDALTRAAAVVEGQSDPLRAASELNGQVSSAVASVVQKALALSRNQRHVSAAEMRSAMRAACEAASFAGYEETVVIGAPRRVTIPIGQENDPSTPPAATEGVGVEKAEPASKDDETMLREEAALQEKVEQLVSAGASAFDARQYALAVGHWEAALKLSPDERGVKESIDSARRLIRKEEGRKAQVDTLVAEGTEAFDAKRYELAVEKWNEALSLSPNEPGVEASIKAARAAAENEAQRQASVKQLVSQGTKAFDGGNFESATRRWSEALSLSPDELGVRESIEAASQKLSEISRDRKKSPEVREPGEIPSEISLPGTLSDEVDKREIAKSAELFAQPARKSVWWLWAISASVLLAAILIIAFSRSAHNPNSSTSVEPTASAVADQKLDDKKDLSSNTLQGAPVSARPTHIPPPASNEQDPRVGPKTEKTHSEPLATEKRLPEAPKIIRKSGGVFQGSATWRVEPTYPPLAKAARVNGSVVVEVTVDESGNVIAARAISGHPLLKIAAVEAARGWKFTPTQLSGVPVKVIGTITFNFNL